MIQDMLVLVKQGKQEEATELLRHLRQVRMGRFLLGVGGLPALRWGKGSLRSGTRPRFESLLAKRGHAPFFAGLTFHGVILGKRPGSCRVVTVWEMGK